MEERERVRIGGVPIDNLSFQEAVERIVALAREPGPHAVVTPNADHVVLLQGDAEFRKAYDNASLVLPDGTPLVWMSRLLGTPLKERVTGADLLPALAQRAETEGLSLFLLGAPPGVAQKAAQVLLGRHPRLKVAGTHCPPFGFEKTPGENEKIIESIRAAAPDLIFVALGAPRQELWVMKHMARFEKGVFLGVGAAVGFVAGTEKRAPRWMQKSGMEWFYRLMHSPGRLGARYAKDFAFFGIALKNKGR